MIEQTKDGQFVTLEMGSSMNMKQGLSPFNSWQGLEGLAKPVRKQLCCVEWRRFGAGTL